MTRHLHSVPTHPSDRTSDPIFDPFSLPYPELVARIGLDAANEVQRLRSKSEQLADNGWAENTRISYAYWWSRFTDWCANPSLRWEASASLVFPSLPTSPDVIRAFITDLQTEPSAQHPRREEWSPLSPASVDQILRAVRWHHLRAGFDSPVTPQVKLLQAAVRRQAAAAGREVKRARPLVFEEVRQVGSLLSARAVRSRVSALREAMVVASFAAGYGLTDITRLEISDVPRIVDKLNIDHLLARLARTAAVALEELDCLEDGWLIPAPTSKRGNPVQASRAYVQSVLHRTAEYVGAAGWTTSDGLSPELACLMIDGLLARQDVRAARDHALILAMFGFGLRRSEVCALRLRDVTIRPDLVLVRIRHSKTDPTGKGSELAFPAMADPAVDPVTAIGRWRDLLNGPDTSPLFRPVDRFGVISPKPLAHVSLSKVLRERVVDAGIVDTEEEAKVYSSHSPRRGLATSLAEAGVPAERIADQTRHQSINSVGTYIDAAHRRNPVNNPLRALE